MLSRIDEAIILLAALAALILVIEFGFRLGRRHGAASDDSTRSHVGALQGALLGLLALLLGFTFAMAVSRFDTRKALVLEEANAIGTTYLRASLLAPPRRQEVETQLRAYVDARLAFYDAGSDAVRLQSANAQAARLEANLWAQAVGASQDDPRSVPTGLFVQALNDVIDLNEKRLVALENHVPEIVIVLLFGVALASVGFVAFGAGLTGRRQMVSTAIFAALIAIVLATIIDIDRPRRGLIRVSQDSMLRLKASLHEPAP